MADNKKKNKNFDLTAQEYRAFTMVTDPLKFFLRFHEHDEFGAMFHHKLKADRMFKAKLTDMFTRANVATSLLQFWFDFAYISRAGVTRYQLQQLYPPDCITHLKLQPLKDNFAVQFEKVEAQVAAQKVPKVAKQPKVANRPEVAQNIAKEAAQSIAEEVAQQKEAFESQVAKMKADGIELPFDDFLFQLKQLEINTRHGHVVESAYEVFSLYLHRKVTYYMFTAFGLELVEFFRDSYFQGEAYFSRFKPDYVLCHRHGKDFLPLFSSEIKNARDAHIHDAPHQQLLYSSPLPSPFLNWHRLHSTVVGTNATVYLDKLCDVDTQPRTFNIGTIKGALGYVHCITKAIKDNYNTQQQVISIRTQPKSHTVVSTKGVYKLSIFQHIEPTTTGQTTTQKQLQKLEQEKLKKQCMSLRDCFANSLSSYAKIFGGVAQQGVTNASITQSTRVTTRLTTQSQQQQGVLSPSVSTADTQHQSSSVFLQHSLCTFFPGDSLDCLQLSAPQLVVAGRDIFIEMHNLHKNGFTHNDIRPPNIVVGDGGRARLIDFEFVVSQKRIKLPPFLPHLIAFFTKTTTFAQLYTNESEIRNSDFLCSHNVPFFTWLKLLDAISFCQCFEFLELILTLDYVNGLNSQDDLDIAYIKLMTRIASELSSR